jgi:hypothetical protein
MGLGILLHNSPFLLMADPIISVIRLSRSLFSDFPGANKKNQCDSNPEVEIVDSSTNHSAIVPFQYHQYKELIAFLKNFK